VSTSMEQVARLLAEIPYIQDRPGITIQEVARAFSITEAQVRSDIGVAIFCGLPGGLPDDLIDVDFDVLDDEGALYLTNPTSLDRPLRLTATEAAGLQLALMAVRSLVAPDTAAVIDSLLAKIAFPASQSVGLVVPSGDPAVRAAINQAVTRAERLELTYHGWTRGATTRPVVDPARVYVANGVAYLAAYDTGVGEWRTYRVENIAAARPTGEAAAAHGRPPGVDAWAKSLAASPVVRLKVRPQAAWIGEYYSATQIKTTRVGAEIALPVADPMWLVRLLLSLGDQVRSVSDESYARAAADVARGALDAYERLGADV